MFNLTQMSHLSYNEYMQTTNEDKEMEKKRIFTTGEVAEYCGVSFRTVIRWIQRGHLKAYQLPGRGDNRVELQELLYFLEKNKMSIPVELKKGEKNNRVLIVENEHSMARSLQRTLKSAGLDTDIAFDGFQAGAKLPLFNPALITLDLQMPEMNGVQVLKFVRELEKFKHTKILIISGAAKTEIGEAMKAGADDFLEKPFDNKTLLTKVNNLLGIQQNRGKQ